MKPSTSKPSDIIDRGPIVLASRNTFVIALNNSAASEHVGELFHLLNLENVIDDTFVVLLAIEQNHII